MTPVIIEHGLRTRLASVGYSIESLKWIGSEQPPQVPDGAMIVLYVTLGTLQETIKFYMDQFAFVTVLGDLRVKEEAQFEPNTIQWVMFELKPANRGLSPEAVHTTHGRLPGLEVLAFLSQRTPGKEEDTRWPASYAVPHLIG